MIIPSWKKGKRINLFQGTPISHRSDFLAPLSGAFRGPLLGIPVQDCSRGVHSISGVPNSGISPSVLRSFFRSLLVPPPFESVLVGFSAFQRRTPPIFWETEESHRRCFPCPLDNVVNYFKVSRFLRLIS